MTFNVACTLFVTWDLKTFFESVSFAVLSLFSQFYHVSNYRNSVFRVKTDDKMVMWKYHKTLWRITQWMHVFTPGFRSSSFPPPIPPRPGIVKYPSSRYCFWPLRREFAAKNKVSFYPSYNIYYDYTLWYITDVRSDLGQYKTVAAGINIIYYILNRFFLAFGFRFFFNLSSFFLSYIIVFLSPSCAPLKSTLSLFDISITRMPCKKSWKCVIYYDYIITNE